MDLDSTKDKRVSFCKAYPRTVSAVATIIAGHRVGTFRNFLRPSRSVVVNALQNIFAAIDSVPRDLHIATNCMPRFDLARFFIGL